MSAPGYVPPNDQACQEAVLSACMLKPELVDDVRQIVDAQDWYGPVDRIVWEHLCALVDAGEPVDSTLLATSIRSKGDLDAIGGVKRLIELSDATPAISHVEQHARVIADKAWHRRAIGLLHELLAEARTEAIDVDEFRQRLESRVYELTERRQIEDTLRTSRELGKEFVSELHERQTTDPSEYTGAATPSRIQGWNRLTGGYRRGAMYVIAARPGHGKSALCVSEAIGTAERGLGVGVISVEMPRRQYVTRAVAQIAGVDSKRLASERLDDREWQKVADAANHWSSLPIFVDDRACQTVSGVRSAVRRGLRKLRTEHGKDLRLGLIIIDYLQRMKAENLPRTANREQEIGSISEGIANLALEFDVPTIAAAQLGREFEKNGAWRNPQNSHLRESGRIEQDAFAISFIVRPELFGDEESAGTADMTVTKVRDAGSTGRVPLAFRPECALFSDIESREAPDDLDIADYDGFIPR